MNHCAFLLSAALVSSSAFADEVSGFSLGIGAGRGEARSGFEDAGFSDYRTSYKVFVGWRLGPYVGIEGSYIGGGTFESTFEDTKVAVDIDMLAASLVGRIPVHDKVTLFARAGYGAWNADAQLVSTDGTLAETDDGEAFTYGVGISMPFDQTTFRLEYEAMKLDAKYETAEIDDIDFTLLSASIEWRF